MSVRGLRFVGVLYIGAALSGLSSFAEDRRLERLKALAELWGRAYLIHPQVAIKGLDYEKALVEAIPAIEKAEGPEELAAALNRYLIGPLDDPFSGAYVSAGPGFKRDPVKAVAEGGSAGAGIDLIDLTDPDQYQTPAFLDGLYAAAGKGPAKHPLFLDLRWTKAIDSSDLALDWLGLFIEKELTPTPLLSRSHEGWSERNDHEFYRQRWQVEALNPIASAAKENSAIRARFPKAQGSSVRPIVRPLVFVVNNTSFHVLRCYLDALQAERQALVAWQRTGPFAIGGSAWREGVEVRLSGQTLLPRAPGTRPPADLVADLITPGDLATLARQKLMLVGAEPIATPFVPVMRFASAERQTARQISREERIASLIKVWVVMTALNPHIGLADSDWPELLSEWIPRVEAADTFDGYYQTISRIGAKLHDSHVGVVHRSLPSPDWVPGIMLRRLDGRVYVIRTFADVADRPDVRAGDEVISIDGRLVSEIEAEWRITSSHSTEQSLYRGWVQPKATGGKRNTPVVLQLSRDGMTHSAKLDRTQPSTSIDPNPHRKPYERLLGDIGYIQVYTLRNADLEAAMHALADTRGLILDLRGYPRFVSVHNLIGRFLSAPRRGYSERPIAFGSEDGRVVMGLTVRRGIRFPEPGVYTKPLVVLIDSTMISAAEHIAMNLRDEKRATFLGNPTKGTNGNVTRIQLPGGGWIRFTGMRMRHADGSQFQNIGVLPDIWVEETLQGLVAGRDELFERGLDVLRKQLGNK